VGSSPTTDTRLERNIMPSAVLQFMLASLLVTLILLVFDEN